MKITIHYWMDASGYMPFCAVAEVNGKYYYGCGHNFKDAKERLKNDIKRTPLEKPSIPPDEEIEI